MKKLNKLASDLMGSPHCEEVATTEAQAAEGHHTTPTGTQAPIAQQRRRVRDGWGESLGDDFLSRVRGE